MNNIYCIGRRHGSRSKSSWVLLQEGRWLFRGDCINQAIVPIVQQNVCRLLGSHYARLTHWLRNNLRLRTSLWLVARARKISSGQREVARVQKRVHAAHEICDERARKAGAGLALGGIKIGLAKDCMNAMRALESLSEHARGFRHEIHRFQGVLIGERGKGLGSRPMATSVDDAMVGNSTNAHRRD